jgi:hypothetical protein
MADTGAPLNLTYYPTDGTRSPEVPWNMNMGAINAAVLALQSPPRAHVYHNANQSIPTGSGTVLALNSEREDTDAIHDNVTNNSRLTCKAAGTHLIVGNVEWAANAIGYRRAMILYNGTSLLGIQDSLALTSASITTHLTVAAIYRLAVNDYVELQVAQDSGSSLFVLSTASRSPEFSMIRLGD